MNYLKERIIVFLFPLLLSLPFMNRAYFVDDNYFVEIATWLEENPNQPYHFKTDDAGLQNPGWEEDGFVRMVNPLFHHYFLAQLLKIGGHHTWFLRFGCVMLVCFSALFLIGLARRWTKYPMLATLLVLVTPVHWLTAHSLLIDSTLGFMFIGGLYFFIRGFEKDSLSLHILSGLFMGMAILTKYPGVLIIPLTAVWMILYWKKLNRKWMGLFPWAIGLGFLTAYSFMTANLYGEAHIIAASKRMLSVYGWTKMLIFFVFMSGVSFLPFISWRWIGTKRLIFFGGLIVLLTLFFSSPYGGFEVYQAFLLAFFFTTTLVFFDLILVSRNKLIYPRDAFLIIWVAGFSVMMFLVMAWVAARYYVIVIPAVIFLCVRLIEIHWKGDAKMILSRALALILVFSSMLAYADYQQAEPSRRVGKELRDKGFVGGPGFYYLGDSFTMSYLGDEGWTASFRGTRFQIGDYILSKEVTMPPIWNWSQGLKLEKVDEITYPSQFPIKVMHYNGSAGFYASIWGALPFTFHEGPWERFHLFKVVGFREENSKRD